MYVARLSHKSFPEECNDGTELSSSAYVCDSDSYKIISLETHDSGSVFVVLGEHVLGDFGTVFWIFGDLTKWFWMVFD